MGSGEYDSTFWLRINRRCGVVFRIILGIPIAAVFLSFFILLFYGHHLVLAHFFENLEHIDRSQFTHYLRYVVAGTIVWVALSLWQFRNHWSTVGKKNAFSKTVEEIFSLASWVYWIVKKTFGLMEEIMERLGRWLYRKTIYDVYAKR